MCTQHFVSEWTRRQSQTGFVMHALTERHKDAWDDEIAALAGSNVREAKAVNALTRTDVTFWRWSRGQWLPLSKELLQFVPTYVETVSRMPERGRYEDQVVRLADVKEVVQYRDGMIRVAERPAVMQQGRPTKRKSATRESLQALQAHFNRGGRK